MKATVTITIEAESVDQIFNVVAAGLGTGVTATVAPADPPEAPAASAEEELTKGQKAALTRAANKAKKEAAAKAEAENVAEAEAEGQAEAASGEEPPAEAPAAAPEAPTMDDLQAAIKAAAQNPEVGVAGVRECLGAYKAKTGNGQVAKMTDLKEADYVDAITQLNALAAGA